MGWSCDPQLFREGSQGQIALTYDRPKSADTKLFVAWNWNRDGARRYSQLHHNMTAALTDLGKPVRFQNLAHVRS